MTVQPTRDQLRALAARAADDGCTGNDDFGHLTVSPAVLVALLDQLDAAEARVAEEKSLRMKATAAATEAEARIEAWEKQYAHDLEQADAHIDAAEARIQAVEDVLAAWHVEPGESGLADDLLRALNT